MSKTLIGVLAFGSVVVAFLIMTIIYVVGINNTWVDLEESIKTQYKQNQNIYTEMFRQITQVAQVPQQYAKDLENVYKSSLKTRYGEEGSKAIFQMITEQNPNLDPSLYKQVQQVIESGETKFAAEQTMFLDKKRIYESDLKKFPNVLIARVLGFPKIDMKEYDIVTSSQTDNSFKTKKAEPLDVFKK